MRKVDFKSMSVSELGKLKEGIEQELDSRSSKIKALEKLKSKAEELGISLDDLLQEYKPSSKTSKKSGPVAVKYKHPTKDLTWTGRGKSPVWVKEYLEEGNSIESLAV